MVTEKEEREGRQRERETRGPCGANLGLTSPAEAHEFRRGLAHGVCTPRRVPLRGACERSSGRHLASEHSKLPMLHFRLSFSRARAHEAPDAQHALQQRQGCQDRLSSCSPRMRAVFTHRPMAHVFVFILNNNRRLKLRSARSSRTLNSSRASCLGWSGTCLWPRWSQYVKSSLVHSMSIVIIIKSQLGFPDQIPAEVPADAATNEEFLQAAHHALLEVRYERECRRLMLSG